MSTGDWFDHDRFGLFVHFGVYAVPARHEWVLSREQQDPADYARYAEEFDPDLFDARDIARRAREAGMRYAVLTTKHHDGFCLWDSDLTDFTTTATCDRDLVDEWVRALRAEGLRVGFYHSLIDWSHPDFPIDEHHPLREHPDRAALDAGRDMSRYRAHLHGQVRELLSRYGSIGYLFFDFSYPGPDGKGPADWGSEELLALVRELQPGILVNDRLGIPGDLVTPEQYQPSRPLTDPVGRAVRWEACQTTNGSWGYDRDNLAFKTPELLVRMLVDSVACGGNMLLNVGPDGRGGLRGEDQQILRDIGEWMRLHERSVIGAGAEPDLAPPRGTVLTRRRDRLYIHLQTWPMQHVHLAGAAGRVRFARLLHDGSEVPFTTTDPEQQASAMTPASLGADVVTFTLPVRRPDVLLPVLEVRLHPEEGPA